MKKSCLLISLFFTLSLSTSFSAEIRKFNKIDDNIQFFIQSKPCYNFGDSLIFLSTILTLPDSVNTFDSTYTSKLVYYYNNQFSVVGLRQFVKDTTMDFNALTGYLKDKNNDYWFSFSGGALYKLSGTTYTAYDSLMKSNSVKGINSMYMDDNMNLYLIAMGNLIRWDGTNFETLADYYSGKYFYPNPSGTDIIKFKEKLYYFNHGGNLSYYDLKENKIDTVDFYKFIKKSNYRLFTCKYFEENLYITYSYDEILHFAKYDGENFTELDYYFDSIYDGNPIMHTTKYSIDKDGNFYFNVIDFSKKMDSIFIVDKNMNKTSIYFGNLVEESSSISAGQAIKLSNGEVYLPNSYNGFLVITNPTSVETPSNILLMNDIRPNPSNGIFNIDFGIDPINLERLKVEVYDYLGRSPGEITSETIYDASTGKGTITCNATGFHKGMYIVVLSNGKYNRVMTLFLN